MLRTITKTVTNADTFPVDVDVPPVGKFLRLIWYSVSLINRSATKEAHLEVRTVSDADSAPVLLMSADDVMTVDNDQGGFSPSENTDRGDGSAAVIKIAKDAAHDSTDFSFKVVLKVEEIK